MKTPQLRATLFDMDGLLVDTEILWHQAEVEIFGSLGVAIDDVLDRSTKGMYVDEVVDFWYTRSPWVGPSRPEIVQLLLARVGELVELQGRELPGARRAISLAQARGPVGLASSTPLALIERILSHFGLRQEFAVVHSAEFEPYGKPHPGVFLTAADLLGVGATECLVFEDSAAGVLAAKAANMTAVAVPTLGDRSLAAFSLADLVLQSLEDLSEEWLDAVFVAPADDATSLR